MKNIFTLINLMVFVLSIAAQTSLQIDLRDAETGEPILFGTVVIYQDGALLTSGETDLEGIYSYHMINPGEYDIEAFYTGYKKIRVSKVLVEEGMSNQFVLSIPKKNWMKLAKFALTEVLRHVSSNNQEEEQYSSSPKTKNTTKLFPRKRKKGN